MTATTDREQTLLEIRAKIAADHHNLCGFPKTGECDCYNRHRYADQIFLLAALAASEPEKK